jgi:hypothetical protein
VCLFPTLLQADVTASILGTAMDKSGSAVPAVRVTATNIETGFQQSTMTDSRGEFRVLAMPVGTYRLEAELSGFQKFVEDNIVLTVDQQHRVDIKMEVGSLQQSIEVKSNTVQVETTSTQLGQVIDDQQMLNLPLNGRSYIDLLSIQAGVAPQSSATGNISVNGQRGSSNSFLVNGGDVNENVNFGASIIPNLDSVAEFRLITNAFDAEYGRFSGAVMNAITKSGTNAIHGSAFDFLRNSDLDSRSFFNPSVAVLKRNQFGYAAGGPAIRNKIFWFTDYQGTRTNQGSASSLSTIPSVAQRNGTFDPSLLNGTVTGPYWAQLLTQRLGYTVTNNEPYSAPNCTSTSNCVFPNGVIPASAMSPIAVNMLQKYVPLPDVGTSQFLTISQVATVRDDKIGERLDFVTKRFGNWYGYYHFDDTTNFNPSGFGPTYGNFSSTNDTRVQQIVLANTKTIRATMVNEARLDFTRNAGVVGEPTDPEVTLSSLGFVTGAGTLGIINSGPSTWQSVPPISLNDFSFGRSNSATGTYENTWHAAEVLSKVWKTHNFKFGGEFRYLQVNERNIYAPNGNFSFDGSETGSDIADFLLGAPASYTQASFQVLDSRTRYGAAFVQDSWRVKSNFTLNYGLRWEVSMPWYDTQNKIETIVPGQQSTVFPGAPPGWVFPGDKGIPSTLAPTTWKNFGPRMGFAWAPDVSSGPLRWLLGGPNKTSIHGGAGIYYQAIQDAGLFEEVADAPYGLYWVSISPPLFDQPFLTRADGSSQTQRFPFILPVPGSAAVKNIDWSVFYPITSSPGYLKTNKLPYTEQYNFTIERQLDSKTVLKVAYVAEAGHKLFSHYEANPGNAALCLSLRGSGVMKGTTQCGANQENTTFTLPNGTQIVGTRQPLGSVFYGENSYLATTADSIYNSMQATVERRAGDFTFLVAYTFSKSLDDASSYGGYLDFENFKLGRAISTFDSTHVFVASYNYTIPFYRAFGSLPSRLTQGWSLNGITRFNTGLPVTLSESGDHSLTGGSGVDRPNYLGGLVIDSDVKSDGFVYFNKSAFSAEALGAQGTAAPRIFHGPGIENFDLGLQKITKIRERTSIQFRAEFFNALNHANFSNPSGSFTSANFGKVTAAGAGRIGQMSLKFLW